MNIVISNNSSKPIYEQITNQIKNQIMDQTLKPGDPLPSIRVLARDLHVSVITVKSAYDLLQQEGFIDSVIGKGSFVAHINKNFLLEEKQRQIEEHLEKAIVLARESGISKRKLKEFIDFYFAGDF